MRKLALGILISAFAVPAMTAPASAQRYDGNRYERQDDRQDRRDYRRDARQDRREDRRDYRRDRREDRRDYRQARRDYRDQRRNTRVTYVAPRPAPRYANYYDTRGYYNGPVWRGDGGRYYCHRQDGTTGILIGGVAGALIGSSLDRPGDSTGALIGGILGAVIGNEIATDDNGRRCR
ncbi:glycine zipper 2TM domain-containing protein [Stakelama tenebrarum]|uniref:17 kDa surface antigen n=1 Tax=Stakelama tenebrarum TaxID=2711215 RepID=A0A6G6Y3N4_9SPHN|nr:glycine zipper 2TM domain-containing protein [Sphingosinithalassobacter tenebrarum]QIG79223.1 glycine zipper 2TM domain-containing protein [Sphingosinithalassobacter tenebrarum]